MSLYNKAKYWLRRFIWKYEISYERIYNIYLIPSKFIMSIFIQRRIKIEKGEKFSKQKQKFWIEFYNCILQLPCSLIQSSVYKLFFYPRVIAHLPIESAFREQKMQFEVHFIYGEDDWMNNEGAFRLV